MERLKQSTSSSENPNPLYSEHLSEDAKPIIICAMDDDFDELIELSDNDLEVEEIDHGYIAAQGPESGEGIWNSTEWLGVISEVNTNNKFSAEYRSCVGLVVVGTAKDTGENLSFLLHIDAQYFFGSAETFTSAIRNKLKVISDSCLNGTIDAVMYGGRADMDSGEHSIDAKTHEYNKALDIISGEIVTHLGFEPIVYRPKSLRYGRQGTVVYFDNANRRLFLAQEERDLQKKAKIFIPSQKEIAVPKYENLLSGIKTLPMKPWED